MAITPYHASLIDPDNPACPIRMQAVPTGAELQFGKYDMSDPLHEDKDSPVKGLTHRYPDRVLLKVTHACPVYCRFCFRREMVGPGGPPPLTGEGLAAAVSYIAARPEIFEVILTGGDPLVLSPRRDAAPAIRWPED